MQSRYLVIFIFCLYTSSLRGQTMQTISIGGDLSVPSSSLKSSSPSFGGSLQYLFKFNAPVGLQFHVGYNHFKDALGGKVNFLPVRAGVVSYLYEDLLYVYADAGISHYQSPTTTTKQDGFSFGIGAGFRQELSRNNFLQFSAYYNLHNFKLPATGQNYNYTWFNVRAAYGFSFGRKKTVR
jgi:hypothetical protein